jgi:hypothetical protein
MPQGNPWERWSIIHTTRDGYPILTETALWQLTAQHPEVIERVSPTELYVYLDRPYRVMTLSDRSFCELVPAPGRKKPS